MYKYKFLGIMLRIYGNASLGMWWEKAITIVIAAYSSL